MVSASELTGNRGKIPLVLVNGETRHDLGVDVVKEVEIVAEYRTALSLFEKETGGEK
jgi:hypothetical protein